MHRTIGSSVAYIDACRALTCPCNKNWKTKITTTITITKYMMLRVGNVFYYVTSSFTIPVVYWWRNIKALVDLSLKTKLLRYKPLKMLKTQNLSSKLLTKCFNSNLFTGPHRNVAQVSVNSQDNLKSFEDIPTPPGTDAN